MDGASTQAGNAAPDCAGVTTAISTRPATLSLVIAVVLRLSPVGMDVLAMALAMPSPWSYVGWGGLFYLLILLPLYYMVRRHGWAAWRVAPKRVIVTLLIVTVSVAVDAWAIHGIIARAVAPGA